jgi:LysM repeat protein
MKRIVLFITGSLLLISGFSQREKAIAYIAMYKDIAIGEMIYSGVPAAITLAQGILESQFGESSLCKESNNHFGIKCKSEWTGDKVYHDDDRKNECFRSYPDAASSYRDHSDFLKNRPYYADLFQLDPADYKAWAYGLKKDGYATERDYPQQLMSVINDYNLNQYTLIALQKRAGNNSDLFVNNGGSSSSIKVETAVAVKNSQPPAINEEKEEVEMVTKASSSPATISYKNNYPDGIFTINHIKVIYVKEGTCMLSLANQYDINLSKLLDFNEMSDANVLERGTLIFLEKKMKKGDKDFHLVDNNETLYDICQKEGVRMDCVLQYNGLRKNMQPLPGERIYLRSVAPVVPKTVFAVVLGNDSFTK